MEIRDVLSVERTIFDMEGETKEHIIEKMSKYLVQQGLISDEQIYLQSVLQREEHATTGIGNGIAIPHGKSAAVKKSAIVFARTKHQVEWQALDDKPVRIIFLLAISENDKSNGHLQLISEIAKRLMDDHVVEKLSNAKYPEEIIRIFDQGDEK
ncbi:PTS sugar transporter subunit IIA [Paraliobacillus salinarum]|uniref:PTS sugar transporter subunit IIA n=1 Tax=Paraliobacillus salinarum TaxID=1158996 RepID=UPI0015F6A9BE|nr:PTS sugar transporter subunit IIA [Paraliobacillus salinarum]